MIVLIPMVPIRFLVSFSAAVTALTVASTATASKPPVAVVAQTFVERVSTDVNGRQHRVLAPPQDLSSGDHLVFMVRYRNDGATPVSGFAVTSPVSTALRIHPSHPDMEVSVDNGRSWGRLDRLSVATPLGGTRRATSDDVTHVRWLVPQPIRPGYEGRVSYRATVR